MPIKSFVGIPRSDFKGISGCLAPSYMDITETDMPNEQGQNFKGVLCHDPCNPFVQYKLVHRKRVNAQTFLLKAQDHCMPDLASTKFNAAKTLAAKGAFQVRLRNCSLTAVDLDKKIGKLAFQDLG